MFFKLITFAAAAAGALGMPCAAQAQRPAKPTLSHAAPQAAARADIRFAPPLGQTLRYRLRSMTWLDRMMEPVTMLLSVRFDRVADGYELRVTHTPEVLINTASPRVAAIAGREMTFRLDARGALIGMVDEDAYWAALEAAGPETMRERGGPVRPRGTGVAPAAARQLPEEARLALLAETVLPIISSASQQLVTGEPRREPRPIETLFGRLSGEVSTSLERVVDGIAFVRREATVPRRRMDQLANAVYVEMGGPRAARAPRVYVADSKPAERAEVSIETGLARRYSASREANIVQGGALTQMHVTTDIELVEPARAVQVE